MQQGKVKKSEQLIKIVNIEGKSLHIFWTTWGISIKIFTKDVVYDNIKGHKKPGFHSLSLENMFGKKQGVSNWSTSLLRVTICFNCCFEQANIFWVYIGKDKHFWGQHQAYHALCCSILNANKILAAVHLSFYRFYLLKD